MADEDELDMEFACTRGCQQIFKTMEEYEKHFSVFHKNTTTTTAKQQGLASTSLGSSLPTMVNSVFELTIDRRQRMKCPVSACDAWYMRPDHLVQHVSLEHQQTLKLQYPCPECTQTFETKQDALQHFETAYKEGLDSRKVLEYWNSLPVRILGEISQGETEISDDSYSPNNRKRSVDAPAQECGKKRYSRRLKAIEQCKQETVASAAEASASSATAPSRTGSETSTPIPMPELNVFDSLFSSAVVAVSSKETPSEYQKAAAAFDPPAAVAAAPLKFLMPGFEKFAKNLRLFVPPRVNVVTEQQASSSIAANTPPSMDSKESTNGNNVFVTKASKYGVHRVADAVPESKETDSCLQRCADVAPKPSLEHDNDLKEQLNLKPAPQIEAILLKLEESVLEDTNTATVKTAVITGLSSLPKINNDSANADCAVKKEQQENSLKASSDELVKTTTEKAENIYSTATKNTFLTTFLANTADGVVRPRVAKKTIGCSGGVVKGAAACITSSKAVTAFSTVAQTYRTEATTSKDSVVSASVTSKVANALLSATSKDSIATSEDTATYLSSGASKDSILVSAASSMGLSALVTPCAVVIAPLTAAQISETVPVAVFPILSPTKSHFTEGASLNVACYSTSNQNGHAKEIPPHVSCQLFEKETQTVQAAFCSTDTQTSEVNRGDELVEEVPNDSEPNNTKNSQQKLTIPTSKAAKKLVTVYCCPYCPFESVNLVSWKQHRAHHTGGLNMSRTILASECSVDKVPPSTTYESSTADKECSGTTQMKTEVVKQQEIVLSCPFCSYVTMSSPSTTMSADFYVHQMSHFQPNSVQWTDTPARPLSDAFLMRTNCADNPRTPRDRICPFCDRVFEKPSQKEAHVKHHLLYLKPLSLPQSPERNVK